MSRLKIRLQTSNSGARRNKLGSSAEVTERIQRIRTSSDRHNNPPLSLQPLQQMLRHFFSGGRDMNLRNPLELQQRRLSQHHDEPLYT